MHSRVARTVERVDRSKNAVACLNIFFPRELMYFAVDSEDLIGKIQKAIQLSFLGKEILTKNVN